MKHFLFNGSETPEEIKAILLDHCEGRETMAYTKQLTNEELADFREGYVDNTLDIGAEKEVLDAAKDAYKVAVKPLKEAAKTMLKVLKTRHIEITGDVYKVPNHTTGFMDFVNDAGTVVLSRRLKPDEKQGSILRALPKAVNE